MNNMREIYIAPEAEIVRFAAEEKLAFNDQDSFLGFDVTDNQDGDWNGWEQFRLFRFSRLSRSLQPSRA